MKPLPRIRKTVKWGGAVVSVLLLVVWVGSGWWAVRWTSFNASWVDVDNGQARVYLLSGTRSTDPHDLLRWPDDGWSFEKKPRAMQWWFDRIVGGRIWYYAIPLWLPCVVTLGMGGIAWRLDTLARRRARIGFCPKCSYNRAGLTAGAVCPECGSAAPVSAALRTKGI